jgi:hypothetical protein
MSAITAPMTSAPPIRAREDGASWNASHIQNGISGVSSVAIRAAWLEGSRREPSMYSDRPIATWQNPNIAKMNTSCAETVAIP